MLLLQFSTSHYCRKARLALGYKKIDYRVENLTPGLHLLKVKPLTGLGTLPVLLPERAEHPKAIADSTRIFEFLEQISPDPPLYPAERAAQQQAQLLEDWLDESIGTATRFVYYQFRATEGKALDNSLISQAVIQIVRRQYQMTPAAVELAAMRLHQGLTFLQEAWQEGYLVGNDWTIADLAAAALLSPLARIPYYVEHYPGIFNQIAQVHHICGEALPPGMEHYAS